MASPCARLIPVVGLAAALAYTGCGGGEGQGRTRADQVRAATTAYLRALENERWARACRLMTAAARREIAGGAGSCASALEHGGALPADEVAAAGRAVAGARVRVRGRAALIEPLGSLPGPLRLRRVGADWLIDG
jgi:hypothetical protein